MLKRYLILMFVVASIVFLITFFNDNIKNLDGELTSKNINTILEYLDSKYTDYTFDVNEINFEVDNSNPKDFEYHASIFLKLINDLNVIRFKVGSNVYKYYFDDINTIFHYKLKDTSLLDIKMQYKYLKEDMYYLGNIKGIHRVYVKENICDDDTFLVNKNKYNYYLDCYNKDDIVVFDSKYNRFTLNDLIERKVVNVEDLSFYNIFTSKEEE